MRVLQVILEITVAVVVIVSMTASFIYFTSKTRQKSSFKGNSDGTVDTTSTVGSTASTATLWTVQSEYTSALTISSAVFINPKSFWPAAGYFYEAIELHVPTTGMYTISSSSSLDTQGFLYNHSYDLASPQQNLIAFNDDAGGTSNQFKLAVALQAMARYILLVTTYLECVTGSFTIIGLGPAELNFSALESMPIEVAPIYSSALTMDSTFMWRTPGSSDVTFYQAVEIEVTTASMYMFLSNSAMDMYGYLYKNTFDPTHLTDNLLVSNDDGAGDHQFVLLVALQPMLTYTLIVTTFEQNTIGDFTIMTYTSDSMRFSPSNASTNRFTYLSSLTQFDPSYSRPGVTIASIYYYKAVEVTVSKTRLYMLRCNSVMDTYGYIYEETFDPAHAAQNLLLSNDDSGGDSQFMFVVVLEDTKKYVLVVTTFRSQRKGVFSLTGAGDGLVHFSPVQTTANSSQVESIYSSALTEDSPIFCRRNPCPRSKYYYQAIQLNVSMNGTYTFLSSSSNDLDAYGYMYNNTFRSSSPASNRFLSDDDSGGDYEFMWTASLLPTTVYTLVVTTSSQEQTGTFSVVVVGDGPVGFTLL